MILCVLILISDCDFGCGIKANCLHKGPGPEKGVLSASVFLRLISGVWYLVVNVEASSYMYSMIS